MLKLEEKTPISQCASQGAGYKVSDLNVSTHAHSISKQNELEALPQSQFGIIGIN